MSYWIFSLTVLIVGFLTGFSIGALILPIGVALILLGPVRHRQRLFWPVLMGLIGFELGYLLFVPLTCTATAAIPGGAGETVCTSILGPEYRASGVGAPPTDLARLVGVIAAAGAAVATLAGLTLAGRREDRP
ncbi:MAG: hypothetical protein Q8M74_02565 [Chloroflexota bacterium]|nr:hypothetical protein [Chloroflexota bacterium]